MSKSIVYMLQWDQEDCRFTCYDETLWDSIEAAINEIYEWCERNKEYLLPTLNEDGFMGSFEAWIAWCIVSFCCFTPHDIYSFIKSPADNEDDEDSSD